MSARARSLAVWTLTGLLGTAGFVGPSSAATVIFDDFSHATPYNVVTASASLANFTTPVGNAQWNVDPTAHVGNGWSTTAAADVATNLYGSSGITGQAWLTLPTLTDPLIRLQADITPRSYDTRTDFSGVFLGGSNPGQGGAGGFSNGTSGSQLALVISAKTGNYTVYANGTNIILASGAIPGGYVANQSYQLTLEYQTLTHQVSAWIGSTQVLMNHDVLAQQAYTPSIVTAGFRFENSGVAWTTSMSNTAIAAKADNFSVSYLAVPEPASATLLIPMSWMLWRQRGR